MTHFTLSPVMLVLLPLSLSAAGAVVGWRGNWTGLYPDAKAPVEWHRIPKGALAAIRTQADKPDAKAHETALPLENGLIRPWLILGPFAVKDAVKEFDNAQFGDEATVQPSSGAKAGELTWKPLTLKGDDPWAFGEVELAYTDLASVIGGYKPNQMGYAHTWVYSPKDATVRAVVEHTFALKVWLNGKVVYRSAQRGAALGSYVALSKLEFNLTHQVAPRFELPLKAGWNRLLFKVSTETTEGWKQQRFALRLQEMPDVAYETKNILWMAELPHRSNAAPIVVGERVFVMAEPDELICLDRNTGKILWKAVNNYYEALTPDERKANPAFAMKVDPLLAALKEEKDQFKRVELRHKIQKELTSIDKEKFAWKGNDHFESHFGIVGFTTPTPVSDGKHVWVWLGNGVAACYDLTGNRKWIKRISNEELSYASSPALADGVLAVFLHKLIGIDAATGKILWEQKKVSNNNGAVLTTRLRGKSVLVSQKGDVIRPRDGELLHRSRFPNEGIGWAPGVVLKDVLYQPLYGVGNLHVVDFTEAGDTWKPKTARPIETPPEVNRGAGGKWIDRACAGSPLVVDGLAYMIDIYGWFYAYDLQTNKVAYYKATDLRGLFHYNALPVASSPTLIGKHIIVQDNQGTALVLEPGKTFKQTTKNRLATQLDRPWPIPAQETTAYAPPVADGNRLYIRGERYLYCIGEK